MELILGLIIIGAAIHYFPVIAGTGFVVLLIWGMYNFPWLAGLVLLVLFIGGLFAVNEKTKPKSKAKKPKNKKYADIPEMPTRWGKLPDWEWQGSIFKERRHRQKAIGFVYLIIFTDNRKYVGRKFFDYRGSWKTYVGSGKLVKALLTKYKRERIVQQRVMLSLHWSEQDLYDAEIAEQKRRGVVKDRNYLNLRLGDSISRGGRRN